MKIESFRSPTFQRSRGSYGSRINLTSKPWELLQGLIFAPKIGGRLSGSSGVGLQGSMTRQIEEVKDFLVSKYIS